jgi:riboflavin kinase/FMN adenylyltransferase
MALLWRDQIKKGGAVTIGIFDGVHRGHQLLLERARTFIESNPLDQNPLANDQLANVVALTFYPHPTALLAPDREPTFLLTLEERITQLLLHGADAVAIHEFTQEFANLTAEEFIEEILIKELQARHIVVGANFTFGHKALGNTKLLASRKEFSLDIVELEEDVDQVISSTRIRALIKNGEVESAHQLLTRPHQLSGEVIHGEKRGREIGYPTANIKTESKASIPSEGVYAGWLSVGTHRWQAAISIGRNPTFPKTDGERAIQVEAYAIDQEGLELYGQVAQIEFGFHLRETLKFDSLDELLTQMAIDVERARELTS